MLRRAQRLSFAVVLVAMGCGTSSSTPQGQQDATVIPVGDGGVQLDTGNGGGSYTFDTVKALRNAPPAEQTDVVINLAVVTGLSGNYKTAYIQDADGGAKSGIAVFCNPTASRPCTLPQDIMKALRPGQKVKVTGTFDVYNGLEEIKPTAIETLDATEGALPAPTDITAAQAANSVTSSDYEGVLVNITGLGAGSPLTVSSTTPEVFKNTSSTGVDCTNGPQYGAFEATDGASTIAVTTDFYRSMNLQTDPNCIIIFDGGPSDALVVVGDQFTKMVGVLDVDPFVQFVTLSPVLDDHYTYVPAGDHDGGI